VPTDVEFLQEEIRIFTDDLGFPTAAYPGHDMIDLLELEVAGATDGLTWFGAFGQGLEAMILNNEEYYVYDGYIHSVSELASEHGILVYGGTIIDRDGKTVDPALIERVQGVFEYKGERFHEGQLIEENGILYADSAQFGRIPVGITVGRTIGLLNQLGNDSQCFMAGTPIDMWDGTQKSIEDIQPNDIVTSYDAKGLLVPGRVTKTFRNCVVLVLDVFGLMVTPGHVTLCGDGKFDGAHVPIIAILRSDGALVCKDGAKIRATTGCPVGSELDQLIWAVTGSHLQGGRPAYPSEASCVWERE